jgi:hypothetical protein
MSWVDGVNLINKATEKEIEQKEWEMWISKYPAMNKENFIPFDKFRSKPIQKNNSEKQQNKKTKTAKELIEEAENRKLIHQGKHKGIVKD